METINIHYRAHLTDNYQMKTAQQLISKLKVQLGMEKGYSEELEEEIVKLKEELEKDPIARACFSLINVLVDGPFIIGLRDIKLKYRGSTNQRIIRLNHSDTTYANPEASISL